VTNRGYHLAWLAGAVRHDAHESRIDGLSKIYTAASDKYDHTLAESGFIFTSSSI
jgi:hypothetical protein